MSKNLVNHTSMRLRLAIVIGFVLLAMPACPLWAQAVTGSVTGTVSDASGAVIVGAEVRLINTGTGVVQKTATDRTGSFRFLLLPSGAYALEASSPGFKTFRRDGIIVEVDRSMAVPIQLAVGQVTETVEVVGGTPLLEPNTSALGTVMDRRKVEDLPLNGRNPMGLANLIPTVRGVGYFGGQILSTWRMGQLTVAGGGPLSNAFLIDGIANEKLTDYSAMAFLTVDATQEFKVQTNAMSAEFGRTGGGIISVISKAGTNQFHGSLFNYLRNDKFNANEFFANKAGRQRPTVRVNTFGGTLGGPLRKDKFFFFANYEGYRERRVQRTTIASPTAQERSGDFSNTRNSSGALIGVYDPFSTRQDPARPAGNYIRDQFAGNVIPANRLSPIAQAVLKYYPMPNLPGLAYTHAENLILESGVPINKDTGGIRLDYNLTPTRRLSGRYTRDDLDWGFANYFNNIADSDGRHVLIPRQSAFVQYTDAIAPTLLLDAKLGVNREHEHTMGPGAGFDVTSLGFPASFKNVIQSGRVGGTGFPNFSITDASTFGRPDSTGNPSATGTASVAVTKIHGTHSIKTGFEQRVYRRSDYGTSNGSGAFGFSRAFTQADPLRTSTTNGYGVATFLLGAASSGSAGVTGETAVSMRFAALFLQDDWKVTPKLTLNLGLRWEYEGPVKDRFNTFPSFDPSIDSPLKVPGLSLKGGYVFPETAGLPKGLTDESFKNFGPRFGFAYQQSRKTVVRGGYGILYIPTFGPGGTAAGAGFAVTTTMVTSIDGGLTPYRTLSNPFPEGLVRPTGTTLGALTGIGTAASGQLRNVHRGHIQQWNLTLQHEPWANWLFEAAWVGNHGSRLIMSGRPLNITSDADLAYWGSRLVDTQPNPFYGIITTGTLAATTITRRQTLYPFPQFTSVSGGSAYLGNSIYHAFTLKVEKRFSRGFSMLMGYTASKAIDDTQSTGRPGAVSATGVQNWNNLRAERSKSYVDMPQRMVLTALWEVPFKPKNPVLKGALGGWQINAINTIESGRPIGISAPITGGGSRANAAPGVKAKIDNPTLEKWFNTAAFLLPPSFTYGNVSRTLPDVMSDGVFNIDLSVFKVFPIRERFKLQFRAEVFNLTNTPTFEVPGQALNSATFGMVTATAFSPKPREVQLALKLAF